MMAYLGNPGRYFAIHHTPADTVERISPQEVSKAAAAIAVMAYVVAEMPDRTSQISAGSGILSKLRQRDVQDPRFPRGTIPLDENRALVGAFDEAVGSVRPLGNEQAHGTAHPEEAGGWNSERPCEHLLDNRSAESKRIETLVEHPTKSHLA